MSNDKRLTLTEAREQNRLADFIEQHSDKLAENAEFIALLEKMETAFPKSDDSTP